MKIFINFFNGLADRDVAVKFAAAFERAGVEVWMTHRDVLPGGNREAHIRKAIREVDYFLALVSPESLRNGEHIKEQSWALEKTAELLEGDVFILPIWIGPIPTMFLSSGPISGIRTISLFPETEKAIQSMLLALGLQGVEFSIAGLCQPKG